MRQFRILTILAITGYGVLACILFTFLGDMDPNSDDIWVLRKKMALFVSASVCSLLAIFGLFPLIMSFVAMQTNAMGQISFRQNRLGRRMTKWYDGKQRGFCYVYLTLAIRSCVSTLVTTGVIAVGFLLYEVGLVYAIKVFFVGLYEVIANFRWSFLRIGDADWVRIMKSLGYIVLFFVGISSVYLSARRVQKLTNGTKMHRLYKKTVCPVIRTD